MYLPPFLFLELADNAKDIVYGYDGHQENEECEADGVDGVRDGGLYGAANNTFNNDEEKPTTVKRGNRDEINEREVDGDYRHNGEEISETSH